MISPVKKFMNAPAAKISSFAQKPWFSSAAGSVEASSSPSMAQKPPKGRQRREYSVSPFFFLKMAGPMPMENSFTRTPQAFAARKCPNSWTAMSTPNTKTATRI